MCPIYEHECTKCSHIQVEVYPYYEKPKIKCEKCKAKSEKIISGGHMFDLKGEGFYSGGKSISKRKDK